MSQSKDRSETRRRLLQYVLILFLPKSHPLIIQTVAGLWKSTDALTRTPAF
jgi:hypothetical protein